MSHDIPYIMAPGKIEIALQGIKKASVPPKVTQDFVKQVLGIKGGTGDQVTTYLKKIGFSASDGTPTETYKNIAMMN